MDRNEKRWIFFETSKNISNSISGLFVSLFLWQAKEDISLVLLYFLSLYVGIPIFGMISSYISEVYSAKISFFISYLAKAFLLISLVFSPAFFVENPVTYGLIYALDIGFIAIPRNAVFQNIISQQNFSRISAILGTISTVVGIVIPPLGTLVIVFFGGYGVIFTLALISLVISGTILLFLRIATGDGLWQIKDIFSKKHSKDFKALLSTKFISGIKDGIEWALFGVLTLSLVGNNLPKWGIVTTVIQIISVLAGLFYIKHIADKKDLPVLLSTGVLYAAVTVIFIANFTFTGLIVFLIINAVVGSFLGNSSAFVTPGMISEDNKWKSLLNEYWAFIEIPLALGRVIPILILLLADISLKNDFWLKVLFLVIGTIPIVTTDIIRKSNLLKDRIKNTYNIPAD